MKVKNIYIYIYINSQNITIGINPYNKLAKKKKKNYHTKTVRHLQIK